MTCHFGYSVEIIQQHYGFSFICSSISVSDMCKRVDELKSQLDESSLLEIDHLDDHVTPQLQCESYALGKYFQNCLEDVDIRERCQRWYTALI